jgi:hypothetical protein
MDLSIEYPGGLGDLLNAASYMMQFNKVLTALFLEITFTQIDNNWIPSNIPLGLEGVGVVDMEMVRLWLIAISLGVAVANV